ncbi:MAG: hypothetical protein C4324_00865 [Blastocatellia bacterium]
MQRKSHNSLILLATLGVYLGLLLVGGAAAQIFAHSATTRFFEIAEEQETKDDLDNNPTGLTIQHRKASRFETTGLIAVRAYLAFFAANCYCPKSSPFIASDCALEPTSVSNLATMRPEFTASDIRNRSTISPVHLARASI